MNTSSQQTNEQLPIPQFVPVTYGQVARLTDDELAFALEKVTPNNSWQRNETPWKSNYSHACAASELGEFLYSTTLKIQESPAQYETSFVYQNGTVVWTADKTWETYMHLE